jgi:hypothetical protein
MIDFTHFRAFFAQFEEATRMTQNIAQSFHAVAQTNEDPTFIPTVNGIGV